MKTVRSTDGTPIAYDQLGAGSPVILVDGAFCSRSFGPMPKLAPLLARHFAVFAYDRRGRGDSGDTVPYAVEREVEDLDTLIRQAGGSACVYAISSGAALALRAAASGLRIKKLALYEPPFMVGDQGHRPPANHVGDFSLPTKRAASVTIPTLVISGEKSFPVLRQAAARLAEVIPGARHRTLARQTHNASARILGPVLQEFFAEPA